MNKTAITALLIAGLLASGIGVYFLVSPAPEETISTAPTRTTVPSEPPLSLNGGAPTLPELKFDPFALKAPEDTAAPSFPTPTPNVGAPDNSQIAMPPPSSSPAAPVIIKNAAPSFPLPTATTATPAAPELPLDARPGLPVIPTGELSFNGVTPVATGIFAPTPAEKTADTTPHLTRVQVPSVRYSSAPADAPSPATTRPERATAAQIATQAATEAQAVANTLSVRLIVTADSGTSAVLFDGAREFTVVPGDKVGPYTVQTITTNAMTLRAPSVPTLTLSLPTGAP